MKMNVQKSQESKAIGFNCDKVPHKDVFSDTLYRNGVQAVGDCLNNTRFSPRGEPALITKGIPTNYESGKTSMTNHNLKEGVSMNNSFSNADTRNGATDGCKCAARL